MNDVTKELLAQLVDEIQALRDKLKESEDAVRTYKQDAFDWYRRYTEASKIEQLQTAGEKLETELPDMGDLNND